MIKKQSTLLISFLIIMIFMMSLLAMNKQETILTSLSIKDTQTMRWGIKRGKDHMQPDVGAENKKILEEKDGICLGNDSEKVIYLTFDEGYEAGYTEIILNILKENNVKATFFITSHYLNSASDLVERMINEGHIVGNHTCSHPSLPSITDDEIKDELMKLHQAVFKKFNYEMKYMRPPKGEFNERTLQKTQELGYKTVMWSFAYFDWDEKKQPTIEESKKMIIDNLHCGEIMLLHPTSRTNCEVLGDIIKEAKSQGYVFKSLDEFE